VFQTGVDLTMVGLDVTHRALMRPDHAQRLSEGGRAARLVAELFAFYTRFHQRDYGWEGAPVHDALALAHVVDGTLLTTTHCGVVVDTGPELSRGRTNVDLRGRAGWTAKCHVAVAVYTDGFLNLLGSRVEGLG
jgi:purine nucleosidase/pyrimidine-specific ribonucleoside hydrolase